MKEIILGTAGHIDHGKTSLIKAITGVNTDRLKEEQKRGITIELGFASLALPSGQRLGIVDVPGHEKFVKNMVAGATGIDIVAMVIAADEGVMPQTREHMEICSLLGIRHGCVALTKTDMVDEDWLELVTEDIRDFLRGSFLEEAPIVPVSAATGAGLSTFVETLDSLSKQVPEHSPSGIFRLPVDRVFTMKGFGTVITGSLVSGRVRLGETIMVYPKGITSKVRGVQVHNQTVEEARVGQRTAINFQGLDKDQVDRGDVVSTPGALVPSYMLDVSLHYLSSNKKAAKNRTRIRFHTGTSEVMGLLIPLDREEIAPGEIAPAQIRLDAPMSVIKDDRFVIRSYSPIRTIGGGQILNPIPPKHKRFRKEIIDGLEQLSTCPPDGIVSYHAGASGYGGISFAHLKLMTNLPDKPLDTVIQGLLSRRELIQIDKDNRIYIHGSSFERLHREISDHLTAYHKSNPLKTGMPKEELKSKFPSLEGPKLFNQMILHLVKENAIVAEEESVRLTSHRVSLAADQTGVREKILDTYAESGLQPPYFKELGKNLAIDPKRAKDVLLLLVDEGHLIKVKEDLYFHTDAVEALKQRLVDFLTTNGAIDTPQFKDMTGASRKYVIPLIEYYDSKNITIRIGDIRKLRKAN
ncbi:MAG: selenocysteine-specific translation elongation factor [Desulfobacterales bacterium]|nr:selenocysteine-specific translation elongation factor [Desulfobacterales bacterium]